MSRPKALDLFCCQGGASMGLHQAGFDVTGIDISSQSRYPFNFVQMDVLKLTTQDLATYDFIWASPPCQAYSRTQKLQKNMHPDLVGPVRSLLISSGKSYVIENVEGAPLKSNLILCGSMFEGLKVYRHRYFETNFPVAQLAHKEHKFKLTKMGRTPKNGEYMHVVGNFSGVAQAKVAMNINWMNRDGLRESIPPAYSEYIANQWLKISGHNLD